MAQLMIAKPSTEITEAQSLSLTRNLLRLAIFNISYIRGLFPEKHFKDMYVGDIDMKVKKLLPLDAESRRLIDWMEKGVYDALRKRYLKTLFFGLCTGEDGPLVEQYEFSFSYPKDEAGVEMTINRSSGTKKGKTKRMRPESEVTMRMAICRMVRTLVELMRTLDNIPDERTILMKLVYYDETPEEYEPPFFRACTEEDKQTWLKPPVKMKVGDLNSRHYTVALKVRSTLDPCEDENENENEIEVQPSPSDAETVDTDETCDVDGNEQHHPEDMEVDQIQDGSTIGGLHTTGSDVTRHAPQKPTESAATVSNGGMHPSAMILSQNPALSRESTVRKEGPNWSVLSQTVECSRQSKASMVEKAIYQAAKRLRGQ